MNENQDNSVSEQPKVRKTRSDKGVLRGKYKPRLKKTVGVEKEIMDWANNPFSSANQPAEVNHE